MAAGSPPLTPKPPRPPHSSRRKRAWRIARFVVSLALAAFAVHVVYGQRDELAGATTYLENLRWPWLVAAAGVELSSIVAFAALQRRLLQAGHVAIPLTTLTMITFAGNAIQNSLPAGPVWSGVYAFRQFHERGADDVLAGWLLIGTAAVADIALVILAAVGLAAASGTGSGFDLVKVILGLLVLAVVIIGLWSRRDWIARHMLRPLRLCQRIFKRPEEIPRPSSRSSFGGSTPFPRAAPTGPRRCSSPCPTGPSTWAASLRRSWPWGRRFPGAPCCWPTPPASWRPTSRSPRVASAWSRAA